LAGALLACIGLIPQFRFVALYSVSSPMELKSIRLEIPGWQHHRRPTHFIKSVEDIYEAIVNTVPQMKLGSRLQRASDHSSPADGVTTT
jgi:hypothetical protein